MRCRTSGLAGTYSVYPSPTPTKHPTPDLLGPWRQQADEADTKLADPWTIRVVVMVVMVVMVVVVAIPTYTYIVLLW